MSAQASLAPEEAARADFYALIARLFYAPPDAELLAAIAAGDEIVAEQPSAQAFALAWHGLRLAAAEADAAQVADEYQTLFVGTGKAPVSPYASAYLSESAVDNPLIAIRAYLASHGLTRKERVGEPEDHVAALCETMRHLIASQHAALEEQGSFFMRFLCPGVSAFCDAIARTEQARLYKKIAIFARAFLEIESEAFRM